MNPFLEKAYPIETFFVNWPSIYPRPYNKMLVDPYTKTRIILMNGTELETITFLHQFARHCNNNDLRREIALMRRLDQQQQKVISLLKPIDETILEHTISYEQLAVDLTAELAQREPNQYVKMALDFALLEDFDHLYRYSDLAFLEYAELAENLVGHYTEIMPSRPTIAHHRYPTDNVRRFVDFKTADPITKLNVNIITAAEQQTMNYYLNVQNLYSSDLGRKLYQEIACVEEEHVTQYESLIDPNQTWLENLLMHKYNECYLYYSCYMNETDPYIKDIWLWHYNQEVSQLHKAAELLKKYEGKEYNQVIPNGEFPQLLVLHPNKQYIRNIQANTINLTSKLEDYVDVNTLPQNDVFFQMQNKLNTPVEGELGHQVINTVIANNCTDYRYEDAPNPTPELRDRCVDNTEVGR